MSKKREHEREIERKRTLVEKSLDEVDRAPGALVHLEREAEEEVDALRRQPLVELVAVELRGHLELDVVVGGLLRDPALGEEALRSAISQGKSAKK